MDAGRPSASTLVADARGLLSFSQAAAVSSSAGWIVSAFGWPSRSRRFQSDFRSHFPSGFAWLEPLGLRNPIGFGWYMLGHTQHDLLSLIQLADLTGVYGLTFVVAAVNTLVLILATNLGWWRAWVRMPGDPMPVTPTARYVVVGLVLASVGYGLFRLYTHAPFAPTARRSP